MFRCEFGEYLFGVMALLQWFVKMTEQRLCPGRDIVYQRQLALGQ